MLYTEVMGVDQDFVVVVVLLFTFPAGLLHCLTSGVIRPTLTLVSKYLTTVLSISSQPYTRTTASHSLPPGSISHVLSRPSHVHHHHQHRNTHQ